ncbi:MAG: proline--tRNA ligase [Candidatus Omnitrophica bacterium]|nr:proline--tRNA ligase [Candidatus Omnitrophota bacterium]
MLWSKFFIPTLKETPQEAESISHQLMLRAGLVRMLIAGVYSYLPYGLMVLENIQQVIRQEMDKTGANELLLPALQPLELWQKTERDKLLGQVMIKFTDRRGRRMCLGPTHEEVITELVHQHISSYKQLPLILYQIQTKFRDEIRPRFGLVRSCEFIMKDAYSFDIDEEGLDRSYCLMHQAYERIFTRLGLKCLTVEADSGIMGGSLSHEFMVPASCGEDLVWLCPNCAKTAPFKDTDTKQCSVCNTNMQKINTIEIGHIFKLGTKYSQALEAYFQDEQGRLKPIIMGCYGIGVSRLIATIIEQNRDENGIIWPIEVAPFKVIIIPLDVTNSSIMEKASVLYQKLSQEDIPVLMDDRNERAGVKFKDADLIGVPLQLILGKAVQEEGLLELKQRKTNTKISADDSVIFSKIKEAIYER